MSSQLTDLVSDHKGLAAGAAAAALAPLAPLAAKGIGKIVSNGSAEGVADVVKAPVRKAEEAKSSVGEKIGGAVSGKVEEKLDQAGGPGGILKTALKKSLPFVGGSSDDEDQDGDSGVHGIGEGRRMPVQQSIDVALPIETVYNQWTQFEDWPNFMHRVKRVTQEDRCNVSFAVKIWGKTKEFNAEIVTQRPDDCVKWRVTQGITHTGAVFFRELAPGLTRIELSLDVEPGSLIEKFARGARHVKRAARGDLHRFKAYVEMQEEETGAWRGTIEDGKVKRQTESSRTGGRSSGRGRASSSSRRPASSASGSGSRGRSRTRDH
ncbi:MAG TPA: SRPBCC family protein [Solirubrobacteraceae bacterium]|nr:SRPBCC family protein [Solirubrobacteraceae bacterium]